MRRNTVQSINWNTIDCVACSSTPERGVQNKTAICARCGSTVYYSVNLPADIAKVCEACGLELVSEIEDEGEG